MDGQGGHEREGRCNEGGERTGEEEHLPPGATTSLDLMFIFVTTVTEDILTNQKSHMNRVAIILVHKIGTGPSVQFASM